MIVVRFEAAHLLALQVQEAQQHFMDLVTESNAAALEGPYSFTAIADGKVVAVGGVIKVWEGRGVAWTYVSQNAGPHFIALHNVAKAVLNQCGLRRIEADTPCDFKAGHRWLKMLGFKCEAPCMQAYQIDGADCALYARVR